MLVYGTVTQPERPRPGSGTGQAQTGHDRLASSGAVSPATMRWSVPTGHGRGL